MASASVPPLSFGALLKRYRRLARLTQEQLAERAGFGPSFISMLERGDRRPVESTIELLAAALELSAVERDALLDALQRMIAAAVVRDESQQRQPTTRGRAAGDTLAPPVGGFLGATPEGPLVAREPELRQLLDALDALVTGPAEHAGRLVMLSGEPGIGKTRLAQELALRARECGALVATSQCYEQRQTVAFSPIGEVLAALLAGAPADLRTQAATRWPDALALLPDAPLPDAPLPTSADFADGAATVGGFGARERPLRQVVGCVAALAEDRPVALLLDDLHWADEASLEVLVRVARQTRGARLMILGTYREHEVRRQPALRLVLLDLIHERLVERIALRPMALADTAKLLADALVVIGVGELDARLAEAVYVATQGNPFFARETVRALAQRGEIALDHGRWTSTAERAGELALPQSVRDTLNERVARLSEPARAVLRAASVLGPVFALDPLTHMSGRPVAEVEAALEEALAAELIREAEGLQYVFSHALTRQAIYGEIPAPRRRHLHRAAGEALDQLRERERARRAAEITQHFLLGDALERALPYALQAGDQAARMYAQAEARHHYTLALDLARDLDDQRGEALARERRADVLYVLGHMEDAYADLAAATQRYRVLGDWDRLTWATCQLAKVCDALGRIPESMRFMEVLLIALVEVVQSRDRESGAADHAPPTTLAERAELASTLLAARTAARLLLCLVARFVHLGRFAEAVEFSVPAVEHARRADEPRFESLAYSFRAMAQQVRGELDEALRSLEESRRAAEAAGDLEARFMTHVNLAANYELRAEPGATRANLLRALQALTLLDDISRRMGLLGDLGWNAFVLGEWGESRAHWEEARALGDRDDDPLRWPVDLALLWLDLAEGKRPLAATLADDPTLRACLRGDLDVRIEALRRLAEAHLLAGSAADPRDGLRALFASDGALPPDIDAHTIAGVMPYSGDELRMLLAWMELELGNEEVAARQLAQARQAADARQNRAVYADLWRIEALLALRQGRADDAAKTLDRALALCRAMPHPYAEAKALAVYGQVEQARGTPPHARERYQAALAILDQLGERLYAERVERALHELERVDGQD